MENAFLVAVNQLGEDEFNKAVEAFMNTIDIQVQLFASQAYVPYIDKNGTVIPKHTKAYVLDDIEAISVNVNNERIAYLVEDLDESVKDQILQELFSCYQSLNYDIELFNREALENANGFDFMQYEA